jgi:hypothetical protein
MSSVRIRMQSVCFASSCSLVQDPPGPGGFAPEVRREPGFGEKVVEGECRAVQALFAAEGCFRRSAAAAEVCRIPPLDRVPLDDQDLSLAGVLPKRRPPVTGCRIR